MCRYENVTSEGGDNVTVELVTVLEEVLDVLEETEVVAMESTPETIVGGDEGEGVDYVIPDIMRVTMEPREEVGLYIMRCTVYSCTTCFETIRPNKITVHPNMISGPSLLQTGHLVHVKLTIFDANGQHVTNLGLVHPWMCQASLVINDRQPENE